MGRSITFAENLRHYRTKQNLTQRQLAEKIGYTEKSISKWEGGNALPTMEITITLADLFNISLEEMLFEKNSCYYFLGIDGGGTKTAFKLTDENGTVLQAIQKGSCNPNDIGMGDIRDCGLKRIASVESRRPSGKLNICGDGRS